ncbi:universal stress protein [Streptomyces sp. WAC 00631]|uniref:universal stress protein n=1 Tax=unclassified Streptomyces TaxID=2593676 RepID=UPI000F783D7B|nr:MULTISPECIES: universal stress protein [unclassified Streptomyces]MCC5033857.1 universal stress protein [Streptomyces sp. WAC 00631]MCC9742753.1 universal stress protein [Streptomyces sp. MNU89]
MARNGPVVVGVDGSPSGLEAVEVAAREAAYRNRPLRVVHAFVWPSTHMPLGAVEGDLRYEAKRIVAEAEERARATAPEVEAGGEVVTGEALTVLEEESRSAALMVVGSRGLGGFTRLLIGSVAGQLAAHSHCPVLVVRGRTDGTGPVLVGVDGSPAGEAALDFAFEAAAARETGVVALHAWSEWSVPVPPPEDKSAPYAYEPGMLKADEERLLAESLAGWRDRYPDVPVEHRLVRGRAREALVEASEEARLLVVGKRGRGGFAGLLLGSVSQAATQHAHCPVVVVPHA